MRRSIGDWVFDNMGWGIVVIGVLLVSLVAYAAREDARRCQQILDLARSNTDSINVLTNCGKSQTPIVMPVFIPSGR